MTATATDLISSQAAIDHIVAVVTNKHIVKIASDKVLHVGERISPETTAKRRGNTLTLVREISSVYPFSTIKVCDAFATDQNIIARTTA